MKNQKKNNEEMQQTNIFELLKQKYKITKPIRLIELFAGIGSQAKALKNLGVNFEHYKVCEWDKYAIASYNAIHDTNFPTSDITKISVDDLDIVDTDKYDYVLTYSFPCQDLSLAGNRKGMTKGNSTRSGLLWEVERLLKETNNLPQILLMENVPQVISKTNFNDFREWEKALESLGYSNYCELLNAKNYGIPQNRNRCYMVSILGNYYYEFPKKIKLELRLKDMLEEKVDEKYYLSEKMIQGMKDTTFESYKLENKLKDSNGIVDTILSRFEGAPQCIEVFDFRYDEGLRGRVELDLSPTLTTKVGTSGISGQPLLKIPEATKKDYVIAHEGDGIDISFAITTSFMPSIANNLRIRKLTPKECWRLMGFDDEDFDKASKVNSNAQLYKQAGNSIVVNVLEHIFKQLF